MDREKYNLLYNNNKVVKYYDWSGRHYESQGGKLVVGFFFTHNGCLDNYLTYPEKRIILNVFPIKNLALDIPLYQIKNNFLVLANTGFPDFALTYRITIDEQEKSAKVIVEDYPALGESLMTEDEKKGLTYKFQ